MRANRSVDLWLRDCRHTLLTRVHTRYPEMCFQRQRVVCRNPIWRTAPVLPRTNPGLQSGAFACSLAVQFWHRW